MPPNSQRYTLGAALGLEQRWKGNPASAQTAQDLAYDPRGGWRTGPGYRRTLLGVYDQMSGTYTNPFTALGVIWSLHRFSQGNGARQWLLFESDDNGSTATLRALNPSHHNTTPYDTLVDRSGTAVTGRTIVTTPWIGTQSVTWGNRVYLVNGYDTPIVFDGEMADRAGFAGPPGTPSAREISATTATYYDGASNSSIPQFGFGYLPASTTDPAQISQRCYAVSFINSRGQESPLSAISDVVQTKTGNSGITLGRNFHALTLPTGPVGTVARRVYASQNIVDTSGQVVAGRSTQLFWLLDIEDNVTTLTEIYQDDDALGTAPYDPTAFGSWPAGARIAVDFKGTMFVASADASEVQYSAAGFPEVFPPANRIPIGDAALGPVTGMYATRNAVVVLKQRGVYLIKGDPVNGFWADTLDHAAGCASQRTLVEIPNVGLSWVGLDGIYLLRGTLENEGYPTEVKTLSLPVYEDVREWTTSALSNAVAVPNPREKCAIFVVPRRGSVDATHMIVFHYEVGQFTTSEDWPVRCALNTSDHRAYVFFGSSDASSNPGIHVITRGFANKGGVALAPVYETADLDFGSIFRSINVVGVFVFCIGFGNNDLTLDYKVARRLTYVRATEGKSAQGSDQQYLDRSENRMKVYGATVGAYTDPDGTAEVAVWDTDTWAVWRPIVVRFDTYTGGVSPTHEFAAKLTPAEGSTLMEIVSLDIELVASELNKAKPISSLLGVSS